MRNLFLLGLLFASIQVIAQDSIAWKIEFQKEIESDITWTIDAYDNMYIANKDAVEKIDAKGKKMYEQSVKKYGKITKIDARNPMKVLLFSEQQQSVFYFDNTLTKQENDIDLGEYFDLSYVTQVSASSQVDKFWTFDQDNSKINLHSLKKAQAIQIENISGLTGMKNIFQFFEQNDKLYIADSIKGIFIFDLYGTLIQSIDIVNLTWIDVSGDYLYVLKGDNFEIYNLNTLNKQSLKAPINAIQEFHVNQNSVFVIQENLLIKYKLKIF